MTAARSDEALVSVIVSARSETKSPQTAPSGLKFGSYVFHLGAYLNGQLLSPITFAQPLTLTFTYSPSLLSGPNEARLYVYFWNGTAWSDDGITVLSRDGANHQITIALTHLSEFAFFVTAPTSIVEMPEPDGSVRKIFLPVIGR